LQDHIKLRAVFDDRVGTVVAREQDSSHSGGEGSDSNTDGGAYA